MLITSLILVLFVNLDTKHDCKKNILNCFVLNNSILCVLFKNGFMYYTHASTHIDIVIHQYIHT